MNINNDSCIIYPISICRFASTLKFIKMKKQEFEIEVIFKGFDLYCTGTIDKHDAIVITQVFLSGTDIEISSSLTSERYDELKEVVKEELINQFK
jgi:hypothetical protein